MKKLSLLVLILCMIPFICSAWILKDEFNTNRTAGNVDGTSAEPIGGTRTVLTMGREIKCMSAIL